MSALSIVSDQLWLGNDGPWSPFLIGFGTPAQFVKTLVSTSIPQPYVIIPGGCIANDPPDCQAERGGFFLSNESTTWSNIGDYELGYEQSLGIDDAGDFGFDTISLGLPGSGAPSIAHQIVAEIVATDYYLASWGLRPAATNFTNLDSPTPSLLQSLKSAGEIPSLSWAYTAGSYQVSLVNKYGHGSLTIGGYDTARFKDSNSTFVMAEDTSRDLVVGLLSVGLEDGSESFLTDPILTFLDSGVSHIWLPEDVCQRFETAFNLTYDPSLDLYLVNDTTHKQLLAKNATISFTISNDLEISASSTPITIDLPYSAFDLQLTDGYPGNNATKKNYFPIRRAANDTQYTLGRTFFQHAYVIADYERSTFSVHNAYFPAQNTESLVSIYPISAESSARLSAGEIAGIVGGCLLVMAVLLIILIRFIKFRKRKRQIRLINRGQSGGYSGPFVLNGMLETSVRRHPAELQAKSQPTPELGAVSRESHCELSAEELDKEMNASVYPQHEMEG